MMTSNIDLNGIKTSLAGAYQRVAAKSSEWFGRLVTVLQSGTEKAIPYLQEPKFAVISLIAVTLLLCSLSNVFSRLWNKCCPADDLREEKITWRTPVNNVGDVIIGAGTIVAGIIAFTRYTKLPLSLSIIAGISVQTTLFYVMIHNKCCVKGDKSAPLEDAAWIDD